MKSTVQRKIERDLEKVDQGDVFFARFVDPATGSEYPRPVVVIGKTDDSNDRDDVIVCKCTTQPRRTRYDVEV